MYCPFSLIGSCNLSCLRQRMEKQVKTYIKALKKSINQERFLIRVAGLEYEVAQKLPQVASGHENCGPGREKDSGRCGKKDQFGHLSLSPVTMQTMILYENVIISQMA